MENYELERRKIVAENIKKLIKEKGITQKQLAKEIGMSQNIITEYVKLRSFPPGGVLQKIADYFGVKKSDIDTTWKSDVNSENTPYINETVETMKQLDESRQQVVLATANVQLKEQSDSKAKVIPMKKKSNVLTDEALQEAVDTAVAFDGIPLNEQEKEAAKALIRRFWEEDHPED